VNVSKDQLYEDMLKSGEVTPQAINAMFYIYI